MTTVQWFVDLVMFIGVVTKESRCLVTTSLSKKAKLKHVDLSEVKMDCRCRKLSPFLCQFLSAVGKSEKDCRHILNEQCRLSPKPLGRPQKFIQHGGRNLIKLFDFVLLLLFEGTLSTKQRLVSFSSLYSGTLVLQ